MNFELTEEQRILQKSIDRIMEQEIRPQMGKQDPAQAVPKEIIQALLKKTIPIGALGNTIPEADGGAGLDYLTWGLMYERLEPAINMVIMISSLVAKTISTFGTPEQKEKYLPELLSADTIGCMAITEPNVGSNPAFIETSAVKEGDSYILNGTKTFITNGTLADICIVVASVDRSLGGKGLARFIVDRRETPFYSKEIETLGGWDHLAELVFEDVRVPKENMLGNVGEGLKATLQVFQSARCFVALTAINLAQKAVDASIRYVQERKQFGKFIGSFQLIQEMIADMVTETDASRFLTYRALAQIDKGIRCTKETSMAKFYATEAAVRVTSKAIQIHGAYGLTTEYPVQALFRQARMLPIPDGTTQIQKLIIAREVLGLGAFV